METLSFLHQGDKCLSMGKTEEAIAFYDSALTDDRDCYAAWLGKGTALKLLKRYEDALECYERALALHKDSIMAEQLAEHLRNELNNK